MQSQARLNSNKTQKNSDTTDSVQLDEIPQAKPDDKTSTATTRSPVEPEKTIDKASAAATQPPAESEKAINVIAKLIASVELDIDKVMLPDPNADMPTLIKSANVLGKTTADKAQIMCELFNQKIKAHNDKYKANLTGFGTVATGMLGEQLEPAQVFINDCNQLPEMRIYQPNKRFVRSKYGLNFSITSGELTRHNQDDAYFHRGGNHVLNVPIGQYALAKGNQNEFQLYDEGTHVIDDATFKFDPKTGFVTKNQNHIHHGPLHIVRVQPGKTAAITINGIPYLLKHRSEPYLFNDPTFQLDGMLNANANYIQHNTIQILRVPAGKVAKISINNKPVLLESREQPYVFNNPNVILAGNTFESVLVDATERLITHGSLKRLMVTSGEKALVYKKGKVEVVPPAGEPIYYDDSTIKINEFVKDTLETIYIPPKGHPLMSVTAGDTVEVGIQVAVGYVIKDLHTAITKLGNLQGIEDHITNQTRACVIRDIQKSSSSNFLRSSNQSPSDSFNSQLKEHLHDLIKEYGIEIKQAGVENVKLVDPNLASQMSQQALVSASTNTKVATLQQEGEIARTQAEQKALTDQITQDRSNIARLAVAQTALNEAKLHAESVTVEAKAKAEATYLELSAIGKALTENPNLLPLLIAREMKEAMKGATLNLTAEQFPAFFSNPYGATMFKPAPKLEVVQNPQVLEAKPSSAVLK